MTKHNKDINHLNDTDVVDIQGALLDVREALVSALKDSELTCTTLAAGYCDTDLRRHENVLQPSIKQALEKLNAVLAAVPKFKETPTPDTWFMDEMEQCTKLLQKITKR